jgi:hypothetical protein
MCVFLAAVPVAVQLGLTAAAIAASHVQGVKNAEAQGRAIRQNEELQQADLRRQQLQQQEQAAGAINAEARRAMKDRALFETVSQEYGGGVSVDRQRAVADIYQGERLATMERNAQVAQDETAFRSFATARMSQSRIDALDTPSMFGTALKLGAAYVGASNQKAKAS